MSFAVGQIIPTETYHSRHYSTYGAGMVPTGLRLVCTLFFMSLVLALSLIPGRSADGNSWSAWVISAIPTALQKAMHVLLYALLVVLWAWTLEPHASKSQRLTAAVFVAVAFGAALERLQRHIPGRFGTLGDVVLNLAGASIGATAALFLL